jgi:hypothetical protein
VLGRARNRTEAELTTFSLVASLGRTCNGTKAKVTISRQLHHQDRLVMGLKLESLFCR